VILLRPFISQETALSRFILIANEYRKSRHKEELNVRACKILREYLMYRFSFREDVCNNRIYIFQMFARLSFEGERKRTQSESSSTLYKSCILGYRIIVVFLVWN